MDHDTTNESAVITWSPGVTLEEIEKSVILKAFRFYRGNKTATAQSLGIAIRTLTNKLEGYKKDVMRQQDALKEAETEEQQYALRARGEHPDQLRERFPDQYGGETFAHEPLDSLGYLPDADELDDDGIGESDGFEEPAFDEESELESGSFGDAEADGNDDPWGAEDVSEEDGETEAVGARAKRGVRVQSPKKSSKKPAVSVSRGKKVQALSSKNASRLSLDGGRKGVRNRA